MEYTQLPRASLPIDIRFRFRFSIMCRDAHYLGQIGRNIFEEGVARSPQKILTMKLPRGLLLTTGTNMQFMLCHLASYVAAKIQYVHV